MVKKKPRADQSMKTNKEIAELLSNTVKLSNNKKGSKWSKFMKK